MEMVVSAAPAPKKRERDWSCLLPELIEKLQSKIKDYADDVRFRAVCKNWRSAPRARPVDIALPSQLPWLCLPTGEWSKSTWYMSGCRFFSLSSKKYYTFKPHAPSKKIDDIPFDGRFIFTSNRDCVTLINPITGSQITLPPLPGRAVVIRKASFAKCQDGDGPADAFCVTALGIQRTKKFYVYRSVDGYWNEFSDDRSSDVHDVAYYKGSVIFTMGNSGGFSYDTASRNVTPILIDGLSIDLTTYIWFRHALVQSSSGELLMIFRSIEDIGGLEVFRLVLTEQQPPLWSRVRSIGNDVIFMDRTCRAICIDARGIDGCRSNCVYFTDLCLLDEVGPQYNINRADRGCNRWFDHVYLLDIGDQRVEKVSNSPHEAASPHIFWIIPHLPANGVGYY